jgi:hypothetical protein
MRFLRALAPVLCVLLPLSAVETQVWEHSEAADFEKKYLPSKQVLHTLQPVFFFLLPLSAKKTKD